jgi:hypothetical protein
MTPSRNRLFLACAIALVFGIPTFAQHKTETYQFAGTYHAGFQFGGSSITLGSDGTFRNDSGSCTFTTRSPENTSSLTEFYDLRLRRGMS